MYYGDSHSVGICPTWITLNASIEGRRWGLRRDRNVWIGINHTVSFVVNTRTTHQDESCLIGSEKCFGEAHQWTSWWRLRCSSFLGQVPIEGFVIIIISFSGWVIDWCWGGRMSFSNDGRFNYGLAFYRSSWDMPACTSPPLSLQINELSWWWLWPRVRGGMNGSASLLHRFHPIWFVVVVGFYHSSSINHWIHSRWSMLFESSG